MALSVLQLLLPVPVVQAGDAGDAEMLKHFFDHERYSACDAKLIAHSWGVSLREAKVHIGYKIEHGTEDLLNNADLPAARKKALADNVRCHYPEGGYGYDDAALLAGHWGVSIGETKTAMGEKLFYGGRPVIEQELAAARRNKKTPGPAARGGSTDPMEVFFGSRYDYCDAHLISVGWEMSVGEAKAYIGEKIINGYEDLMGLDIAGERAVAANKPCRFLWTPYSYADAEAYAKHWKSGSISDTKTKLARIHSFGGERREALRASVEVARRAASQTP